MARNKVRLRPKYRPTSKERFMNPVMRAYFRKRLLHWKQEILGDTGLTLENLKNDTAQQPDLGDRAAVESTRAVELRTRDRARKLIAKIDAAIVRIDKETYGFCEETSEPISLKRLEARPIATLSLEAQEQHERHEKTHRDD